MSAARHAEYEGLRWLDINSVLPLDNFRKRNNIHRALRHRNLPATPVRIRRPAPLCQDPRDRFSPVHKAPTLARRRVCRQVLHRVRRTVRRLDHRRDRRAGHRADQVGRAAQVAWVGLAPASAGARTSAARRRLAGATPG
ncbi:hypothetical protein GCM10027569_46650 [Flindersiella endophytica]